MESNESSEGEWEYRDREGAIFRFPKKWRYGPVQDVLHGNKWVPYAGDRLKAYLQSDLSDAPILEGDFGGETHR
jgi:hypothetical protein